MIKLSEMLPPRPEPWWPLMKQCGVDNVVALRDGAEQDQRMFSSVGAKSHGAAEAGEEPWGLAALTHNSELFATHGFTVAAYEDTAPIDKARLGLPGRDEQIENVITQIKAMGRLGIPTRCYHWMALESWGRADNAIVDRGGGLVSGFNLAESERRPDLVAPGEVTEE